MLLINGLLEHVLMSGQFVQASPTSLEMRDSVINILLHLYMEKHLWVGASFFGHHSEFQRKNISSLFLISALRT